MDKVEGLFIRTKRKPYRWICKVQRKGVLYAGIFHRFWSMAEEQYGKHRVKRVYTTEIRLTDKQMKELS